MSSGNKTVVINTFQRAASADINNLQTFIASDRQQALRRMVQRPSTNRTATLHPGLTPDVSTLPVGTAGTVHDVYAGLMIRPDMTSDILIDPGQAGFIVPAFTGLTAEDSPYIVVDSPGVQSTGVLTFTANASGSPRIDIVECQPVLSTTTASRDIFDPVTQTFSSNVVDVESEAILTFRIRQGVANAGFPDIEQDWCPLAFIVIQNGATGFDQSDFYDIRPLVNERTASGIGLNANPNGYNITSNRGAGHIKERQLGGGETAYTGYFFGEFEGYQVGGEVRQNTPTSLGNFGGAADTDQFLDLTNTENQLSGAMVPSQSEGRLNGVMALFPQELGRCVRYSQNPLPAPTVGREGQVPVSGRLPRGPNGIIMTGGVLRSNFQSAVTVQGLVLPALFGTADPNLYKGVIVGWTVGSNSALVAPFWSAGKSHYISAPLMNPTAEPLANTGTFPAESAFNVTGSLFPINTVIDWSVNGLRYPVSAVKVTLRTFVTVTVDLGSGSTMYTGNGPFVDASSFVTAGSLLLPQSSTFISLTPGTVVSAVDFDQTVQIPVNPPASVDAAISPTTDFTIFFAKRGAGLYDAVTTANARIFGWEEH